MRKGNFLIDVNVRGGYFGFLPLCLPKAQAKSHRLHVLIYIMIPVLVLLFVSSLQTVSAQSGGRIQGVVLNELGTPLAKVSVI